jgi:hypothetical protein
MDKQAFWDLLEDLDPETAAGGLAARLDALEPAVIAEFQRHFDEEHARAYQWQLWGAAYLLEGGCSDDGFIDFRYGLISRGQEVFERALADPDSLADLLDEDDFLSHEEFGYVAREIYEFKAGAEMPQSAVSHPAEPSGEEWDFDDEALCAAKLPKLWAKFGG